MNFDYLKPRGAFLVPTILSQVTSEGKRAQPVFSLFALPLVSPSILSIISSDGLSFFKNPHRAYREPTHFHLFQLHRSGTLPTHKRDPAPSADPPHLRLPARRHRSHRRSHLELEETPLITSSP